MRVRKIFGMSNPKNPRYELTGDQGHLLTDNVSGKVYSLVIDDKIRSRLNDLLSNLVEVANRRGSGFDPLFNCLENLDALFVFMKEAFPPLLTSGVLQPLVDIRAAVHDKVVGAKPPLLDGRVRGLDGRYRLRDEYPENSFKDEGGGMPTRPLRLYRYTLEAVILIAFDALLRGHGYEEAVSEFRKILRALGIRSQDYRPSRPILVEEVISWRKAVLKDESKPAAARAYSYKKLRELHAAELHLCGDRAEGRRFAERTLERVRTLQFTDASSGLSD